MKKIDHTLNLLSTALVMALLLLGGSSYAQCVSITTLGAASSQNFNTLANTGSTNNLTITGWFLSESGSNANGQYAADTGSSNGGNTYSYGAAAATDRALGGLQSGSLIPTIGVCFTNNTGSTIASLDVAYTGEQWRLGTASRTDRLDFQYSLNATSLTSGAWTDVNALDFTAPSTTTIGAKDGNAAANRTALSSTISSLSIAPGATFWLRWTDFDATGAEDGLAVDDFSLTANGAAAPPDYTITTTAGAMVITDVSGNGETMFVNQTGGNIRFDVAGRTFSLDGGPTTAFPADVPLAGTTSITINAGTGDDAIITGATFAPGLPSLTLDGGAGADNVLFNGAITYATNRNLAVVNAETVEVNGSQILSGSGSIDITAGQSITVNAGLNTATGNIDLSTAGGQNVLIRAGINGVHATGATLSIEAGQDIILGNASNFGDARGQTVVLTAGRDISVAFTTYLEADGAGGVTAQAERNLTVTGSALINCNAIGAPNQLTAGVNGIFTVSAGGSVGANGGPITVTADDMTIAGALGTAGTITLRPLTAGRDIDLGTETTGQLSLTDAELDFITSGTLAIGSTTAGHIAITAPISSPAATNVQLRSGGDVVFNENFNTNGGTLLLDPGTSPAAVKPTFTDTDATASMVSFGNDLAIVINGTTPGDGTGSTYTQLKVTGSVDLTGVDLVLSGSHSPAPGQTFVIVDNDGLDAITGTFNGLLQGATIPNFLGNPSVEATIDYAGGDGNDVVLTVAPPPVADYTITTTGNAIVITDDAGNGDVLIVSQNVGNIRFVTTPNTRTYSINGGPATAFSTPADVLLAGATSITINAAIGNDIINIGAFTANLPDLTINGGTGDDVVVFNGDITFAADANLDVDLQNDDPSPGADRMELGSGDNLVLSGAGAATIKVSKSVSLDLGATIDTEAGHLTVEANQQAAATPGDFIGINLSSATALRSSDGNVTLRGRGGNANGIQYGIQNLGTVATTGAGDLLIEGAGGLVGNDNDGVRNIGGITTTGSGDIQIIGFSPTSTASEGFANQSGATVATTTGDLTVSADIIYLDPTSSINVGVNQATIVPLTASRAINLGLDDNSGRLGLTDAELDRVTAGELVIGNATSGAITVSANITRPTTTNLQLISDEDVLISGGGINTAGGTLLLDPGASPFAVRPTFNGTDVDASTLTFGSDLALVINGTTPGNGAGSTYTQLTVAGGVDLTGVDLVLSGSLILANGQTLVIVDNDGVDPITGTFNGLPQGATIPNFLGNSSFEATIDYAGGDGNDVELTVVFICVLPEVTAPTINQPSCLMPTGSIVVNATGIAALEYSIDNGTNWQSSPLFSGLTSGSFTILVRLVANTSCETAFAGNPVVLMPAFSPTAVDTWTGCISTNWDTPGNWQDGTVPTATDEVLIPDVANDPVVMAGTAALAKSVMVEADAALTIAAMGSLTVEGATGSPSSGIYNLGAITNNGQVRVGLNTSPGNYGIVNEAVFNNHANAELSIDRSSNIGFWNRTSAAVLTNAGTMAIGAIAAVGNAAIYNEGDIQNNGGDIALDRFNGAGINNRSNSTISNSGEIVVGEIAASGAGLYNFGHIHNLTGGEIEVDRTTTGIFTHTENSINSSFTNDGKISIGQLADVSGPAIYNAAFSGGSVMFENNAGSELILDRSFAGIHNELSCTFDNSGLVRIGTTVPHTGFSPGIYNLNTFNNLAGGEIRIESTNRVGLHHQSGTFTNGGTIIVGINALNTNFSPGVYNQATFVNQEDAELHIDRFPRVGFQNASNAALTNAGLIKIGENVIGGRNGLFNDGTVDNQVTGEIHVDNIPDDFFTNGVFNGFSTTFTNAGKIFIGSAVGAGSTGLFNYGAFTNSGELMVDRVRGAFNRHGLYHSSGVFTNSGKIILGSIDSIGDWGIFSNSTFNNQASGEISIDRCAITGLRNGNFGGGTFTNAGKLHIGANGGVGDWGLWNDAPFVNSGELTIDNAAVTGLRHQSSTFTNTGTVALGSSGSSGEWGLWNQAAFNNNVGGEISIDRSNNTGLLNFSNTFTNNGTVTIGANAAVGDQALYNQATFNNGACAVLDIYAPLHNVSTFTNAGLLTANTATAHTNTGFTNEGIIAYPQGNPIPNVTNNEIVIAPLTFNGCDVISPAFGLGSPVNFSIVGIFSDAAATVSAGTFDVGANAFTTDPVLLEGTHQLFVKIEDGSGGCTRIIPWVLTTQNCCEAPVANCQAATAVLIGNTATLAAAAVDNGSTADCGLESLSVSPATFNCNQVGTPQMVTLTITDVNGSSSSCTTTVTVVDNTPPTISCPATQTLVLGANCTASLPNYTSLATTGDNCGVQGVTQSPAAGTTVSDAGNMTVTLTATDVNGLTSSCSFTVTKVDNTPPTVLCFNQTVELNGETTVMLDVADLLEADDNCGLATTTLSPTLISCAQLGQTVPVTVTATDVNGLTASCTSQVTVTGLPCGWSQNPDGVGCTDGNDIDYNPTSQVWTATSTNCYYAPPFTADELAFAQRTLCGNGSIQAQVTSLNGAGWAGIVLREGNAPGARKVQLTTNLSSFSRREVRYSTGGQAYPQQFPSQAKYWLRLLRVGNQFVGYVSANGQQWSQVFALTVSMGQCLEAGLVVTNATPTGTVTATFTNVHVQGSSSLDGGDLSLGLGDNPSPELAVFPNPTSGEVFLDLRSYAGQAITVEVLDLAGRLLAQTKLDSAPALESLDLSAYQAGLYLLRVRAEGQPDQVRRVVRQ